jgi:hypothetical protein
LASRNRAFSTTCADRLAKNPFSLLIGPNAARGLARLYPCDTAKIPRHSDFCKQIFISDDWGRFFTIAAQGRTLDSWRGSGSFARLPSGRDPNESRRSRTIQSPSEGKRAFSQEGKRAFRLQGLPRLLPAIRLPAWRAQRGQTACRGLSGADRAAGVEAGELKGRAGANQAESGLIPVRLQGRGT